TAPRVGVRCTPPLLFIHPPRRTLLLRWRTHLQIIKRVLLRPVAGVLAVCCQAGVTEPAQPYKLDREQINVERGARQLVAGARTLARRGRGRRLFELVRAHGPGSDRGGCGTPVSADPLPQKLDSIALCRTRSGLRAGPGQQGHPRRVDRTLGSPEVRDVAQD